MQADYPHHLQEHNIVTSYRTGLNYTLYTLFACR